MAISPVLPKFDAPQAFTITLASLASTTVRQSTLIDNSVLRRTAALVQVKITSGAVAPVAGTVYSVWLIRKPGTLAMDGIGLVDAPMTANCMQTLLGTIVVTASVNTPFTSDVFDTSTVCAALGPLWGIAIKNETAYAINGTEANHATEYSTYVFEAQ